MLWHGNNYDWDKVNVIEQAYHTMAEQNDASAYSEITDWLIDSGCSISMTPYVEDLIGDVQKTIAVVAVATGVLTQAPLQGAAVIQVRKIENISIFRFWIYKKS